MALESQNCKREYLKQDPVFKKVREVKDSTDYINEQMNAVAVTTIENQGGLHARAAFRFVKAASNFKSKITISSKGATVDAKSILMIMGLPKGTEVTITAEGSDAKEAVATLKKLIDDKFGEE